MKQITINFDASPFQGFRTCREYLQFSAFNQKAQLKSIAADMDYSPSQLSRKLTESPDDSARFTLNDLEIYIDVTEDVTPVYYLFEKFCAKQSKEEKRKLMEQLQRELGD